MDFTTDEELDGYLVLILFYVKKEKVLALKKPEKISGKRNIQKESGIGTLQQFSTKPVNWGYRVLLQVSFSSDIFIEFKVI